MVRSLALGGILLLAATAFAASTASAAHEARVERFGLENGLTDILRPTASGERVALATVPDAVFGPDRGAASIVRTAMPEP